MGRAEQLLVASIRETLKEAHDAERALIRERESCGWQEPGPEDYAYEDADAALTAYIEKAFRDVGILAEKIGLPVLRAEITGAYQDSKKKGLSMVGPEYGGDFYCPALQAVRSLFQSIATMTDGDAVTGLDVLNTILRNTAKIVQDRSLKPRNEKEVRLAVSPQLGYAFNDVVIEPRIAHPIGGYKPDFGIQSLMALVEYKHVRTKAGLNKVIDDLCADMKGYSGHPDWRNFYAVIYMDGAFAIQEEVDAKLRSINADPAWTVILITGGDMQGALREDNRPD